MEKKRRTVVGGIVILCLILIAVCNVFIYRTIADLTLAIGVILMGRSCFLHLLKENQSQSE